MNHKRTTVRRQLVVRFKVSDGLVYPVSAKLGRNHYDYQLWERPVREDETFVRDGRRFYNLPMAGGDHMCLPVHPKPEWDCEERPDLNETSFSQRNRERVTR